MSDLFDLIYDQIIGSGIDEVYCISVNDAFVMHQWARTLALKHVKLIPDGNGQFTRRIGMLIKGASRVWILQLAVCDGRQ